MLVGDRKHGYVQIDIAESSTIRSAMESIGSLDKAYIRSVEGKGRGEIIRQY